MGKAGTEMASGISGGGGRGSGSSSGSLLSAGPSLSCGIENGEESSISEGTLKHSDNFTRYDVLCSWDPTNFLMLQKGTSIQTTRCRSRAQD